MEKALDPVDLLTELAITDPQEMMVALGDLIKKVLAMAVIGQIKLQFEDWIAQLQKDLLAEE